MKADDQFFACQRCKHLFKTPSFDAFTGNGITIKANGKSLCGGCASQLTMELAQHISHHQRVAGEQS